MRETSRTIAAIAFRDGRCSLAAWRTWLVERPSFLATRVKIPTKASAFLTSIGAVIS